MIENMQPGRELDALVAEKIMGWTDFSPIDPAVDYSVGINGFRRNYAKDTKGAYTWFPMYSSDISAAWEVVEEMNGKYAFEIGRAGDYFEPDRKWKARFGMSGWVEADTASHAVAIAALLALSEEDTNNE